MRDRRRRGLVLTQKWRFLLCWCTLLLLFFSAFTSSTLRLFFTDGTSPKVLYPWRTSKIDAIFGESWPSSSILIQETVVFPEQAVVFLKYPRSAPLFTKDEIKCIYLSPNSSRPPLERPPESTDGGGYSAHQIVRCPLPPGGLTVSLAVESIGNLPYGPTLRWDSLAYEAMIDSDNTTIVFVKGLNLRGGRVSNPSKFMCFYGWSFENPKLVIRSEVISIAQEIVRCRTPLSVLNNLQRIDNRKGSIKVSVRVVGKRTFESMARIERKLEPSSPGPKRHRMCVCTMLRNQARFMREWVIYHARIGVERWFIYDNNSEDDIRSVIDTLADNGHNITHHVWPWIKTQEAGFAHCALQARNSCEWVGFIDVDEFLHLPSGLTFDEILKNQSRTSVVAELRVSCHSFGPSGLKRVPTEGVTVGYTCRLALPERHKSIVRPEALNTTLINVVHHFHLREGFKYANMDRNLIVINHYKYQVWEVFKEKFYRRVATYVSDWQQDRNEGSKDRTPGLGTRAVEPPDWSSRFCEVADTGLRDQVLQKFADPNSGVLPWQER